MDFYINKDDYSRTIRKTASKLSRNYQNCYDLLSPVTTSPKYTETDDSRRIKYLTIRTKYKQ